MRRMQPYGFVVTLVFLLISEAAGQLLCCWDDPVWGRPMTAALCAIQPTTTTTTTTTTDVPNFTFPSTTTQALETRAPVSTTQGTMPPTLPIVSTSNMPMTEVTTDHMTSQVTLGSCHFGFIRCKDGQCEPFESLCGSTGIVTDRTTTTTPGTPAPTTPVVPNFNFPSTTTQAFETRASASTTQGTLPPTLPIVSTSTMPMTDVTTNQMMSQVTSGSCRPGFSRCKDGRCEPFESLCGSTGVVTDRTTTTTPGTPPPTTRVVTDRTTTTTPGTPPPTTQSTEAPTTTERVTITYAPPTMHTGSPDVCHSGWEQCKDGSCEPFHWLCVEHDMIVG